MKKALIAISGGIDSAVSAHLLKQKGYNVQGVFFILANNKHSQKQAEKISKHLNIPLHILDIRKEFKKTLIDSFLKELKKGNTPNPCIICNKKIKFNYLVKLAKKLNIKYISTGHYVKIKKKNNFFHLYKAKDKDQSYFLWKLTQKELRNLILPLSNLKKSEVKKIAKKINLPISDITDSQEICFIPNTLENFLKKHIKLKPGNILDKQGKILNKHKGTPLYTIGQRKGIKLPQGPYYVLKKKNNYLIVTKNIKDLFKKQVFAKNINWISGKEPSFPLKIKARIRYRHKEQPATITKTKNKYLITFNKSQKAITPGQSIVFYKKNELIGGGDIIK